MSLISAIRHHFGRDEYETYSSLHTPQPAPFTLVAVENSPHMPLYRCLLTLISPEYTMAFSESERVDIIAKFVYQLLQFADTIRFTEKFGICGNDCGSQFDKIIDKTCTVLRSEIKEGYTQNVILHCAKFLKKRIYILSELSEKHLIDKYLSMGSINCAYYFDEKAISDSSTESLIIFKHPSGIFYPLMFNKKDDLEMFAEYLINGENTQSYQSYDYKVE
jgi:hypothetical protein